MMGTHYVRALAVEASRSLVGAAFGDGTAHAGDQATVSCPACGLTLYQGTSHSVARLRAYNHLAGVPFQRSACWRFVSQALLESGEPGEYDDAQQMLHRLYVGEA